MIERRITYSKDKAEIIRRLQAGEDTAGPFGLIADVLVFRCGAWLEAKSTHSSVGATCRADPAKCV